MHLHEVIEYRIKIWTQPFLKIRLAITAGLYFSMMSARYIYLLLLIHICYLLLLIHKYEYDIIIHVLYLDYLIL